MEIRGKAWRPGDLKSFYKAKYVCPAACDDQAATVEAATDRVRAELIAHSGTKNDPNIYYNIDSSEYKGLINDVREKALKEGRKEAWDLARRIVISGPNCYAIDEVNKAFGDLNIFNTPAGYLNIFNTPVEEVLAKDKKYKEEKNALHIGDEVEFIAPGCTKLKEVRKGYVMGIVEDSPRCVCILAKDGSYHRSHEMCEKTGKHNPDIEKVMASFEEEESE